jgi:hypothetical protein
MHNKQTAVIITSINKPTEAIYSWAESFSTFIVPDTKTPLESYYSTSLNLLPLKEDFGITELPYRHYCRKILGYIHASKEGFQGIIDTDDDTFLDIKINIQDILNFPQLKVRSKTSNFVNMFKYRTNKEYIWPRGFPLQYIRNDDLESQKTSNEIQPNIVQFYINGDTDVDAIHRLVFGINEISFPKTSINDVLDAGYFCPFNSQLTYFDKSVFPLLYLPCTVEFRFTDILRGVVAKSVLDKLNLKFAYSDTIGYQIRNAHDYLADFKSEIDCYLEIEKIWDSLQKIEGRDLKTLLLSSYKILLDMNIVDELDIVILKQYINLL